MDPQKRMLLSKAVSPGAEEALTPGAEDAEGAGLPHAVKDSSMAVARRAVRTFFMVG
ncbi:hypothetical protein SDC9_154629 [bioreactor metagenome]|uniref:Uncharacterized protein n=1 Tax=bioreactor metagenome TaxID=1076179 RepID=A0A645F471_9ZZZZ